MSTPHDWSIPEWTTPKEIDDQIKAAFKEYLASLPPHTVIDFELSNEPPLVPTVRHTIEVQSPINRRDHLSVTVKSPTGETICEFEER